MSSGSCDSVIYGLSPFVFVIVIHVEEGISKSVIAEHLSPFQTQNNNIFCICHLF